MAVTSPFLSVKLYNKEGEQICESRELLTCTVDLIFLSYTLSGQEKSSNSTQLCQKLWVWLGLSSQTQELPALMACTGGHLVLHMLWSKSE